MKLRFLIIGFLIFIQLPSFGQLRLGQSNSVEYSSPKRLEIAAITVSGTDVLDPQAIQLLSGLEVGQSINVPGDEISDALRLLWDQKLFSDIQFRYTKIQNGYIWLEIQVKEQPRLSRFSFRGVSKSEADNLREDMNLYKEKIVTENLLFITRSKVTSYYKDKGFLRTEVNVEQMKDSIFPNHVMLVIKVKKNKKIRINEINIVGNTALNDSKLKRAMKETKERSVFRPLFRMDTLLWNTTKLLWKGEGKEAGDLLLGHRRKYLKINILKSSKFVQTNYTEDKKMLMARYKQKGYRDARIMSDTIYDYSNSSINININVSEGPRYYFRNIEWVGNTLYQSDKLSRLLGIRKGDVYDPVRLEKRLFADPNGLDILSLFMDDGYLSFQLTPVEVAVQGDSIDLEIRMYEGQQYRIKNVSIFGNTKTNDHVILREIRTKPGQLFNRSEIIRSQRELAFLGYFDPEQLDIRTNPNPGDGTVDLEYVVSERPSDQIELSGGWGGGRIVGTLGVSFSNFSTRNFFKREAWQPLPAGDGQRLSIRGQTNGRFFQSVNFSFTEPWLGGKRPNAFSVSAYWSRQSNGVQRRVDNDEGDRIINPDLQSIDIYGVTLGLGRRLLVPDDYFILNQELSYQFYEIRNWDRFLFRNGVANNLYYKVTVTRDSRGVNQYYPTHGSEMRMSLQFTPPFSLFSDTDFSSVSAQDRYRWIEYHKWKFKADWFHNPFDKFVINTRVGVGILGLYDRDLGSSPFERFYLGGSGLTGFALDGREIIALRGYDDQSVSAQTGGTLINKYTMELRYPFSLNPQATIYGLTFVEAGNTWNNFNEYNPFSVRRSAGVGVRIFLPMFGLLGLDWGYRFDDIPNTVMQRSQVHFTIGANLGEL
ncbi:MAG: outer membrane protein assembly factor [Salibacteraceae bacterium]